MGELRSRVRSAIHRYLSNVITDEDFKTEIRDIMNEFKGRLPKKLLCQDIGLIIREREHKIPSQSDKFKRMWALLDQVEPNIKKHLTIGIRA